MLFVAADVNLTGGFSFPFYVNYQLLRSYVAYRHGKILVVSGVRPTQF